MTLADAIYQHSLKLPEHAAREALDFIEFLENRYSSDATGAKEETWAAVVARFAGLIGDDFPDDVEDMSWEHDTPREALE